MYILLLSFFSGLPAATDEARVDKDTIALIRESHRASREAIRSLEVKFEVRSTHMKEGQAAPPTKINMEWYERDGMIRCTRMLSGEKADHLWKGGELKVVEYQRNVPQKVRLAGTLGPKKVLSRFLDPWFASLFTVPTVPETSFDQALEDLSRIQSLDTVQVKGRNLYHVRFTTLAGAQKRKKMESDTWFDPSHNYLVCKVINSLASSSSEDEVLTFQEVKPGLFFPSVVEQRTYREGKQTNLNRFTFSTIKINDSIPDKIFDLKFPTGTMVADLHQNVGYVTGENEQPAGEVVPLNTEHPLAAAARKAEERQNYVWLTAATGISLLLAGGVWFAWRRKRARGA